MLGWLSKTKGHVEIGEGRTETMIKSQGLSELELSLKLQQITSDQCVDGLMSVQDDVLFYFTAIGVLNISLYSSSNDYPTLDSIK